MLALISIWKLKDGLPPELAETLKSLAETVRDEPGTLQYTVSIPRRPPLGDDNQPKVPPPGPIPPGKQKRIAFFEVYRDAAAFSAHVTGPAFTKFREENIQFFLEDPEKPGWPVTRTTFLDLQSATIQPEFAKSIE